jgi:hypothetical protein
MDKYLPHRRCSAHHHRALLEAAMPEQFCFSKTWTSRCYAPSAALQMRVFDPGM